MSGSKLRSSDEPFTSSAVKTNQQLKFPRLRSCTSGPMSPCWSLNAQLGAPPVAPLGVVPEVHRAIISARDPGAAVEMTMPWRPPHPHLILLSVLRSWRALETKVSASSDANASCATHKLT